MKRKSTGFHLELNTPITEEDHKRADEEYRELAKRQKERIHEIADKLSYGKELNSLEVELAAAVLHGFADSMSEIRKRPKGHQAKVPGDLAVFVASAVVFNGKSKNAAMEHYAGVYEVDVKTIKNALNKQGYESLKKSMEASRDNTKSAFRWVPASSKKNNSKHKSSEKSSD